MTVTWQTIAGEGDPIGGSAQEYLELERCFRTIKEDMFDLDRELREIQSGRSDEFRGQAADAFEAKIAPICTAVGDVPGIAVQLEGIFRNHRLELEDLHREAGAALARAQTNWMRRESARDDRNEAYGRLSFVEKQVAYYESLGDGCDSGEQAYWNAEDREARDWVRSANRDLEHREDLVHDSIQERKALEQSENQLDKRTARALDNTSLWSMADPSFLEQLAQLYVDAFKGLVDFGKYLFSAEFLTELKKILDVITKYLSYAVLALSILTLIPGLQFLAPVLAVVKVVSLVLSAVSAAAGIGLAIHGEMSWTDALIGAAVVGVQYAVGKGLDKLAMKEKLRVLNTVKISDIGRASKEYDKMVALPLFVIDQVADRGVAGVEHEVRSATGTQPGSERDDWRPQTSKRPPAPLGVAGRIVPGSRVIIEPIRCAA